MWVLLFLNGNKKSKNLLADCFQLFYNNVYQHREAIRFCYGKGTMMKVKIREILFVLGSVLWLSGCNGEEEMTFFPSDITDTTYEENATETGVQEVQLLVYVCGAVHEPGVVALDAQARVVDAIQLAGGMTEEAEETYVNLAAKPKDGEKIYIPTKAEVAEWEAAESTDSKININTADTEMLCTLPGIGKSKAEEIIAYREKTVPFRHWRN